MFDFAFNADVQKAGADIYKKGGCSFFLSFFSFCLSFFLFLFSFPFFLYFLKGGCVGAVCHGPIALAYITVDGVSLIAGKKVAGFCNEEEDAVGLWDILPGMLYFSQRL